MLKKILILFALISLTTSCETMGSVKRGITGEKVKSSDEFFVRKKAPLSLPPRFDELPTPTANDTKQVMPSDISDKLKGIVTSEETISTSSSTEESILKKIKQK